MRGDVAEKKRILGAQSAQAAATPSEIKGFSSVWASPKGVFTYGNSDSQYQRE
jgi:hypothetical protein